jgi:hypothetical protein
MKAERQTATGRCAGRETNPEDVCYNFDRQSGVVQLVARQPLELVILVRVQAPEPFLTILRTWQKRLQPEYFQVERLEMDGHALWDTLQSFEMLRGR